MSMHDVVVREHELVHRPDDMAARILATATIAICLLAFAFAAAVASNIGQQPFDSAQVLNYAD
ncbi:MAG TPA: hypothetical protein VMU85_07570 [Stellaceae bacterium]|nr:hypothetical protein [Stellaceae bacterium]